MAAPSRDRGAVVTLRDELLGGTSVRKAKMAFLVAGFASLVLSVTLWFTGHREVAIFVGLWVPAVHSLGALVLTPER